MYNITDYLFFRAGISCMVLMQKHYLLVKKYFSISYTNIKIRCLWLKYIFWWHTITLCSYFGHWIFSQILWCITDIVTFLTPLILFIFNYHIYFSLCILRVFLCCFDFSLFTKLKIIEQQILILKFQHCYIFYKNHFVFTY